MAEITINEMNVIDGLKKELGEYEAIEKIHTDQIEAMAGQIEELETENKWLKARIDSALLEIEKHSCPNGRLGFGKKTPTEIKIEQALKGD